MSDSVVYNQKNGAGPPFERFEVSRSVAPLERSVLTLLGFDCRGGCSDDCIHEQKNLNMGQRCDEHWMVVRIDEAAVSLCLFSSFRDGRVVEGFGDPLRAATLNYCFGFRHTEDSVRIDEKPMKCTFLAKGVCYGGPTFGIAAEELCKQHGLGLRDVVDPKPHAVARFLLSHCDDLWNALGERLLDTYASHAALAKELPAQCPRCLGAGLVREG